MSKMVKVFDEEHEDDLTDCINCFLADNSDIQILDIRFSVGLAIEDENQIYCFSALLLYEV